MADFMQPSERDLAIEEVKRNAPDWFASVFDFMLKDLANISNQVEEAKLCNEQCHTNAADIETLQKKVKYLEERNIALELQLAKQEDYSRSSNLIIQGIPEKGPNEDIEKTVREFFTTTLKLPNVTIMQFTGIHRLGKPPHLKSIPTKRPRDIIIRFEKRMDREAVWKERFKLKNSKIFLAEDFSPATQQKRRQLLPILRAARKCPEVTKAYLSRDRLFINGVRYTVQSLNALPFGLNDSNQAEKYLAEGTVAFHGKDSFLSNFYPSTIIEDNHSFPTVEHHYQYKRALYFQDTSTATAILKAKTPNQAKALSYDIRDYDDALWQPMAKQTMYKSCALKFQQNSELAAKLKSLKGGIVEANPKDNFFSCGLSLHDPNIKDKTKWIGQNELGNILCKVCDSL